MSPIPCIEEGRGGEREREGDREGEGGERERGRGREGGREREREREREWVVINPRRACAARVTVVSCPAAPPTYGIGRLVTIDAFLGPSAPKWGWPIRVERNDVITLFDAAQWDSLWGWALTS